MSFEFRDAKRQDISLLILLAGGTGSGKTESAMRLATGLAGGQLFAVIDTENGRALHKADDYKFKHASLEEPFTPERYAEAVKEADVAGFPVIVIDSGSHEYEGVGGVLDSQAAEFERLGGQERDRMRSWIAPKMRHKAFVQQLLRTKAHVILALRAEDKVEVVRENGRTVVRPKQSLVGVDGWIPICEKRLPFEATISLLLLAGNPGVPVPVKLEERHRPLVPLDEKLSEATGERLAVWAKGAQSKSSATPEAGESVFQPQNAEDAGASGADSPQWADERAIAPFLELANKVNTEAHDEAASKLVTHREKNGGKVKAQWLADYTAALEAKLPPEEPAEQSAFPIPEQARA